MGKREEKGERGVKGGVGRVGGRATGRPRYSEQEGGLVWGGVDGDKGSTHYQS